jgi:hypothetical protein
MKRIFGVIGAALAAAAVFGGYAVLLAAHVSEPTVITVHGPTAWGLWATTAAVVASYRPLHVR